MEKSELSLKDKQEISLEILQFVHDFCHHRGIRYYLAYGTLLGAVRHKGFIPWDDDVDIMIPRPDYNRFLSEFRDDEQYTLLSCFKKGNYVFPYAKVKSNYTNMILPNGKVDEQGLGIDLFPIDGIPNDMTDETAKTIFETKNNVFNSFVQKYDAFKFIDPKIPKDYLKVFAHALCIGTGILKKKSQEISSNPYNSKYDECERVASVVGIHSGIFRPFKKEWFDSIHMDFEGTQLIGPRGYDEILTLVYHDYMQLPPVEKRVTTHIAKFIWSE